MSDIRRLSDEQPPAEPSLAEWLVRLRGAMNNIIRQIGGALDVLTDKVNNPAGVSMFIDTPMALPANSLVAPWSEFRVDPNYISTESAYGSLYFNGSASQKGVFLMSISMAISGDQKGDYTFHFFVDGVQAGSGFLIKLENQPSVGAISWSHLVRINTTAIIDFRNTSAPGDFVVESADWSVLRVSSDGCMNIPPGVMVR